MDLGWLDTCLRVRDFAASSDFYCRLGFTMVEGEPARGWGVFVRGEARIGLFSPEFMKDDSFCLNFRGGNIPEVVHHLAQNGMYPIEPPILAGDRAGCVKLRDPDGNLIFIDSAPGETQPKSKIPA